MGSLAEELKIRIGTETQPEALADVGAVPSSPAARPEILAPAGNEEMMRAAVENGADAVYFGLQTLNARMRAKNFDAAELPRIMAWLHERGVKGYVTLNTLVFPSELQEAADALLACSRAGVDAVLLQDLGIAALAARIAPELPLHASTQMTVTSAEGIRALERFGLNLERIVAARELSRKELAKLRRDTAVEIEVFVHGALCVAYSGQCLTSEALGGRSANRGECAQACRLPYDLMVDGEQRDLEDVRYLLSPKDLAAYGDITDLMKLGIVSLKIEGRYKTPEYVAATVQAYRKAVDQAFAESSNSLSRNDLERMEMTFSRGFTGGYLHEIDHQAVVEGRFPKKRGVFLGKVQSVDRAGVSVRLEAGLRLGDGVVFDAGKPDAPEVGGRIFTLHVRGRSLKEFDPDAQGGPQDAILGFDWKRVDLRQVSPGDLLWKTSDPRVEAELAASFQGEQVRFRRPVRAFVVARVGEPLALALWDENGCHVEVTDEKLLEAARNRPLTEETLREQLGRLGGTPFELESLDATIEGDPMVPLSALNALRREAVEGLIEARRARRLGRTEHPQALAVMVREAAAERLDPTPVTQSRLSVLCRSLEQVESALEHGGVETIYTDFEDIRLHQEARRLIPRGTGQPLFVPAALRIVKPGEAPFVRVLLKSDPDAVLVRNLASWEILRSDAPVLEIRGDFSLNVANALTAKLHHDHGMSLLTPSYDLNLEQLLDLLASAPPDWFEVTIHQYMPMFHMEHCVFCRFLSTGTDYTNCGRPCESHTVALRDRLGYKHAVKADAGCRNTVFNAIAQSGSEGLEHMLQAGARRFRVDFLGEDRRQVRETLDAYLPAIRGEAAGQGLWRRLNAQNKLGVTRGTLLERQGRVE